MKEKLYQKWDESIICVLIKVMQMPLRSVICGVIMKDSVVWYISN